MRVGRSLLGVVFSGEPESEVRIEIGSQVIEIEAATGDHLVR